MKRLDWFIARRYLSSRRKGRQLLSLSTFIAIGGVAVGVMALIVVIAVMTGLQRDLQEKILAGTPHIHLYEQGDGLRVGQWQDVLARVSAMEGVTAVGPVANTSVMVTRSFAYSRPGRIFGIAPSVTGEPLNDIEERILSGEYSLGTTSADGMSGVLLGRGLAAALGVLVGDTVWVANIENLKASPFGGWQPTLEPFRVTGSIETGMYEFDESYVYTSLEAVQEMLGMSGDTVSFLAINVEDPWRAREIALQIQDELGYPYDARSWMDLNASLFAALKLEKLALALILSLIVVVASFNIVSMLTMLVADKRREIGILKSMGMKDGTVLRIFMLQGLTIGAIGTFLGGVLGGALVLIIDRYEIIDIPADVYFVPKLPVQLDPLDVVLIVVVSMLIAFGATIYPALQAARLQPVDAIRDD